jgi:hypothetical protein
MRDMLSEGNILTAQPTIPKEIIIGPFLNPSNFYRTVYMNFYRPVLLERSLLTLPHQIRLGIMAASITYLNLVSVSFSPLSCHQSKVDQKLILGKRSLRLAGSFRRPSITQMQSKPMESGDN